MVHIGMPDSFPCHSNVKEVKGQLHETGRITQSWPWSGVQTYLRGMRGEVVTSAVQNHDIHNQPNWFLFDWLLPCEQEVTFL